MTSTNLTREEARERAELLEVDHYDISLDLTGGWFATLGHPTAWTILAFGLVGSMAYARSLEHGSPGSATATVWVVEVALAGLVGIAVLGDLVLPGWRVPAMGAIVAAGFGCVFLARAQPHPAPIIAADRQPAASGR